MAYILIPAGGTRIIKEMIEEDDALEGFDTITLRRTIRAASAQAARQTIGLGDNASGYGNMFCIQRKATRAGCEKYECTFTFRGIMTSKPYKVRRRNYSEKQSASPALYPGQSTPVPLEGNQGLVGLTISYVATTLPSMTNSGTGQSPPVSVSTPNNLWSAIVSPIHTYPYGWVLDSRETDEIPGTEVALVTDNYIYYHRYKPGGG